jgi:hypothetical protein
MNFIFGIIIDTFGELRDQRNALKTEIHNSCFICGEARSEIDLHGQGWTNHFMCVLSPFAYIAFIVHVSEQPASDCNGLEKYVKLKVQHETPASSRQPNAVSRGLRGALRRP